MSKATRAFQNVKNVFECARDKGRERKLHEEWGFPIEKDPQLARLLVDRWKDTVKLEKMAGERSRKLFSITLHVLEPAVLKHPEGIFRAGEEILEIANVTGRPNDTRDMLGVAMRASSDLINEYGIDFFAFLVRNAAKDADTKSHIFYVICYGLPAFKKDIETADDLRALFSTLLSIASKVNDRMDMGKVFENLAAFDLYVRNDADGKKLDIRRLKEAGDALARTINSMHGESIRSHNVAKYAISSCKYLYKDSKSLNETMDEIREISGNIRKKELLSYLFELWLPLCESRVKTPKDLRGIGSRLVELADFCGEDNAMPYKIGDALENNIGGIMKDGLTAELVEKIKKETKA